MIDALPGLQRTLASFSPSFSYLLGYIYGLPIYARKVLLKASRIQGPFSTTSRFYLRHMVELHGEQFQMFQSAHGRIMIPDINSSKSLWEIILHFHTLFTDPTTCSLVSTLLRYTPYHDYTSVMEERQRTIAKEITASQGNNYHTDHLCFESLFHLSNPEPYKPGFPPLKVIGSKLRVAARILARRIIVPRLGKKILRIPQDYDVSWGRFEEANGGRLIRTTEDIERVFFHTGVELEGNTEVRSVWRGNDLKPRVYYSRGASLHRATTYIQPIFGAFVDALENTHRILRHSTQSIRLETQDILLIYDYSSFTSNLAGITRFTSCLADYFEGFLIHVLDPHFGPIKVSLGALLHQYNDEANCNPMFDASELLEVEDMVLFHTCGMLGVPGNISSCTLLHGIHLACLIQSVLRNKVVGDDAIGAIEAIKFEDVVEGIADLGSVAREKMEFWHWNAEDDERVDERYDYKKRPLNRVGDNILTGYLLDFPAPNLFGLHNPYHRRDLSDPIALRRKAIRAITKFLDDLAKFPHHISEIGQDAVFATLRWMYNQNELNARGGRCSVCGDYYPPIATTGLEYRDWYQRFGEEMTILLPITYDKGDPWNYSWRVGSEAYIDADPVVGYLCKMGLIEDRSEKEWHVVRDLLGYFGDDFSVIFSRTHVRKYVVIERLPVWFDEYIHSLYEEVE